MSSSLFSRFCRLLPLAGWLMAAPALAATPPPLTLAIAAPMSGSGKHIGPEIANAVQLLVEETNRNGGIAGRMLAIRLYDDATSPDTARQIAAEIAASDALAVIGHPHSPVALAAALAYRDAGLAFLSTAAEDSIGHDNPAFFRILPGLTNQGGASAIYAREALAQGHATVIFRDDNFGRTLRESFTAEFAIPRGGGAGTVRAIALPSGTVDWAAIVAKVAEESPPGLILLAMQDYDARDFLVEMKRRHLVAPVMGPQAMAREVFVSLFKDLPEEKAIPGYFAEGVYAMAPAMLDTANKDTLDFAAAYQTRFAAAPGWIGVKYYEAAEAVVAALTSLPDDRRQDRRAIADALGAMNGSGRTVAGLTGPIRFDADHNRVETFRVGQFQSGRFISAPIQFVRIADPAAIDLQRGLKADTIRRIGGDYYWRQRIVHTGIQMIAVDSIDTKDSLFSADFYMWMRFVDRDGVTDISFPDMVHGSYNPAAPVALRRSDGMVYALYRIKGDFRNEFDLSDYPFDQQRLNIRLANTKLTRDEVVYAVDSLSPNRPRAESWRSPDQWEGRAIERFRDDIVSKAALGDPTAILSGRALEFSGFKAVVSEQRQVMVFLRKNLLPLALLTLVVYSTLFYPDSMLKERLTVPVGAILAASVLLTGIQNKLGDIAYTTTVEIGFYVFFACSLLAMLSALVEERLQLSGWKRLSRAVRRTSHLAFPLTVALTAAIFALRYADRF